MTKTNPARALSYLADACRASGCSVEIEVDRRVRCHKDLADYAESRGLEVQPDPDDNEVSFVAIPASEDWPNSDFAHRIIAEIRGDSQAFVISHA